MSPTNTRMIFILAGTTVWLAAPLAAQPPARSTAAWPSPVRGGAAIEATGLEKTTVQPVGGTAQRSGAERQPEIPGSRVRLASDLQLEEPPASSGRPLVRVAGGIHDREVVMDEAGVDPLPARSLHPPASRGIVPDHPPHRVIEAPRHHHDTRHRSSGHHGHAHSVSHRGHADHHGESFHPPRSDFARRFQPHPPTIPHARKRADWKTPYSYGYFGAQRTRHWSLHHGYREKYTEWRLR